MLRREVTRLGDDPSAVRVAPHFTPPIAAEVNGPRVDICEQVVDDAPYRVERLGSTPP